MSDSQHAIQSPETSFIERLARRIGITADAKHVFGEPVERGGVTIVPVAKAVYGFGGGGKEHAENGCGGGGGAVVSPVGYIEIKNGAARFRPTRDRLIYAAVIAALAPAAAYAVWRLSKAFANDKEEKYAGTS